MTRSEIVAVDQISRTPRTVGPVRLWTRQKHYSPTCDSLRICRWSIKRIGFIPQSPTPPPRLSLVPRPPPRPVRINAIWFRQNCGAMNDEKCDKHVKNKKRKLLESSTRPTRVIRKKKKNEKISPKKKVVINRFPPVRLEIVREGRLWSIAFGLKLKLIDLLPSRTYTLPWHRSRQHPVTVYPV